MPPLSLVILLSPAAGALLVCLLRPGQHALIRRVAAGSTAISLACTVAAVASYDVGAGGYQQAILVPWIRSLGIGFHLGMDGISAVLVLLHALCAFTGKAQGHAHARPGHHDGRAGE